MSGQSKSEVGQTIGLCRLSGSRAFARMTGSKKHLKPLETNNLKKRILAKIGRFLAAQIFMEIRRPKALDNRPQKTMVCPTREQSRLEHLGAGVGRPG